MQSFFTFFDENRVTKPKNPGYIIRRAYVIQPPVIENTFTE